jgi:hypothetical protein
MLLQMDGSPYHWLGAGQPMASLLGALDDATSRIVYLHLRPTEDQVGYLLLLRSMAHTHGLPMAIYHDRCHTRRRDLALGRSGAHCLHRAGARSAHPSCRRTRRERCTTRHNRHQAGAVHNACRQAQTHRQTAGLGPWLTFVITLLSGHFH